MKKNKNSLKNKYFKKSKIKRIENIDSLKFKNVINYLQGCMTRTNTPEQIKLFNAYVNSFGTVKNINYQQYIPWNFASIK